MLFHDLFNGLEETLFMVFTAGLLTWIIGLPLGAIFAVSGSQKYLENPMLHKVLGILINTTRRIPYIVFMIALIPVTRTITGSGEGSMSAIFPLTLAAIPYFAALCAEAIANVQPGLIDAARAVGASSFQILYKVLIPESLPGIINALTTTLIHLIGYSTIAGALGAGGLGSLIIEKGYQSFHADYVLATVVTLIALAQLIQVCGDYIANGSIQKSNPA